MIWNTLDQTRVGTAASRRRLRNAYIQLLGHCVGDAGDLLVETGHFLLVLGGQLFALLRLAGVRLHGRCVASEHLEQQLDD